MNKKLVIRKAHRYIALVVSVQLLFWSLGGLYFSIFPIERIHGDHLKARLEEPAKEEIGKYVSIGSITDKVENKDVIINVSLKFSARNPLYIVQLLGESPLFFDAQSGEKLSKLTEEEVLDLASRLSNGAGNPVSVEWLTEVEVDSEYRNKHLPVYRVAFDGADSLNMYLHGFTGEIVSMRTSEWRIFDFLWMMHVMDYETRDNFNHFLLQFFASLAVLSSLSGLLLWWSSRRRARVS